tara:strand:- start:287 stop:970 length:684 start_codon:yes stop_codon:yes gene_type:complete
MTYELELPSTAEKVKYRPFLVKEQKILMQAHESEDPDDINNSLATIISQCTFNKVDPWKLPSFDAEYLFLKIRGKSVGDKVKVSVVCPDDNETRVDIDVNLEDVNVTMPLDHSNEIELLEGIKLVMTYPTLKDIGAVEKVEGETDQLFTMLKRCIFQIHEGDTIHQNVDMDQDELEEFINSLSTEHLEKINEFFDTMPKLTHAIKVKNPNTKKTGEVLIEGIQSFFD